MWSNPTTDRRSRPNITRLVTGCLFRLFRVGFVANRSKHRSMGTNETQNSKAANNLYRKLNSARGSGRNLGSLVPDMNGAWRWEMKELEIKLGPTLNRLMHEQRVSLKELSITSGVPQSTLSYMRRNRQPRDISTAMAVARALGVSLYYLLYGHEDPAARGAFLTDLASELFSGAFEITVKKIRRKS